MMIEETKALTAPYAPNAHPLDWSASDSTPSDMWAVEVDHNDIDQLAAALYRLQTDIGSVEDRFIHFGASSGCEVTMFVMRDETEGLRSPTKTWRPVEAIWRLARYLAERAATLQTDREKAASYQSAMQADVASRNRVARDYWRHH